MRKTRVRHTASSYRRFVFMSGFAWPVSLVSRGTFCPTALLIKVTGCPALASAVAAVVRRAVFGGLARWWQSLQFFVENSKRRSHRDNIDQPDKFLDDPPRVLPAAESVEQFLRLSRHGNAEGFRLLAVIIDLLAGHVQSQSAPALDIGPRRYPGSGGMASYPSKDCNNIPQVCTAARWEQGNPPDLPAETREREERYVTRKTPRRSAAHVIRTRRCAR